MGRIIDKYRRIKKKIYLFFLPFYQYCLVQILKKKPRINVLFFAMSLPMWRYQNLYKLLSEHPKFNCYVVIVPCKSFTNSHQEEAIKELAAYFTKTKVPYVLGINDDGSFLDVKKKIKPDILFYPQPYKDIIPDSFSYRRFYNKLLCYYPYAFWRSKDEWSYNLDFHKIAWKLFYSTELHRKDAIFYSSNRGRNVEIVGYPTADDFMSQSHKDGWKKSNVVKKRIIWAPHFTISDGGYITQSNFLWMADFMLELAEKYSNKLQFAFKPHPRLFSELCRNKDWGNSKTKNYYNRWDKLENGQVEKGEFIDLFMTSDAMIHDSGSFGVEYHYSRNPVMYIADNFEAQVSEMAKFGQLAMQQHYVGKTKQDIINFIENVVLKGDDPMKTGREQFVMDYLLPPNGKTVAQNTMDIFLKTFC